MNKKKTDFFANLNSDKSFYCRSRVTKKSVHDKFKSSHKRK